MPYGLRAIVVGLVAVVACPNVAHADAANYYGKDARMVAVDLGCAVKTYKPDKSKYWYSGGSCRTGGIKIGFATFAGPSRQAEYKAQLITAIKGFYPPGTYYVAQDKGAIILNESLTRKAASLAHRRLRATVFSVRVH